MAASSRARFTSSLLNKWYFDELYDFLFVRRLSSGRLFWKDGDGTVIDGLGPTALLRRRIAVAERRSRCSPVMSITTPSPC